MNGDGLQDIVVIGGGVIGVSIALNLQSAGRDVLLVDREGIGAGASKGNAGAFAFADIIPLATPGIMRKAPMWLVDPLGPLSVPPAYAPKITPWLLRFWRASWPDRFPRLMKAQAELMDLSRSALERQKRQAGAEHLLQRDGQLQLFEGEGEFRLSLPSWEERRRHGIRFELLKRPETIAEIQPGIDERFTHAGYTPDWINTSDPAKWVEHLASVFRGYGGKFETREIRMLEISGEKVRLRGAKGELSARNVVISAGAWSKRLALSLGDHVPLETERGYNTTLPKGAFDLKTHLTFGGHGFVVSRINDGVRVGGAVELGGLDLPPDFRRSKILLDKAARFLPGLQTYEGAQWMGFRPSMPDSLPVIDHSPQSRRVIYAFGHGHLGLTQAAGTAEIVRDLISDSVPSIPINAFSAQRF